MLEQDVSRTVKYLPASERIAREREREALNRQLQREARLKGVDERIVEQTVQRRNEEEKEMSHKQRERALRNDPRAAMTAADGAFLDPQAARAQRWIGVARPASPVHAEERRREASAPVPVSVLEVQEGEEEKDGEVAAVVVVGDQDRLGPSLSFTAHSVHRKQAHLRMSAVTSSSSSSSSTSTSSPSSSPTSDTAPSHPFPQPITQPRTPSKKFLQASLDDFSDVEEDQIGTTEQSIEAVATAVSQGTFLKGSGKSTPTDHVSPPLSVGKPTPSESPKSVKSVSPPQASGFNYDDDDDGSLEPVEEEPPKKFSVLVSADFGATGGGPSKSTAARTGRPATSPGGDDRVAIGSSLEVPGGRDLSLFDSDFCASEDASVASSDEA
jgi:hypothetical protein